MGVTAPGCTAAAGGTIVLPPGCGTSPSAPGTTTPTAPCLSTAGLAAGAVAKGPGANTSGVTSWGCVGAGEAAAAGPSAGSRG